MTVQITRAHAKALLAMFHGEHAEDILELDHGTQGELLAEWLNQPETQVRVTLGVNAPLKEQQR